MFPEHNLVRKWESVAQVQTAHGIGWSSHRNNSDDKLGHLKISRQLSYLWAWRTVLCAMWHFGILVCRNWGVLIRRKQNHPSASLQFHSGIKQTQLSQLCLPPIRDILRASANISERKKNSGRVCVCVWVGEREQASERWKTSKNESYQTHRSDTESNQGPLRLASDQRAPVRSAHGSQQSSSPLLC